MWIRSVDKVVLRCCTEEKKTDSYDFVVGCFARIDFCLAFETGHKCILSLEITFLRLWFFDQSELEKKLNSINRIFHHWKRRTSEHWLEYFFKLEDHLVQLFSSSESRFRRQFDQQMEIQYVGKCCFSAIEREKKRLIPTALPSVFFPGLGFVWA